MVYQAILERDPGHLESLNAVLAIAIQSGQLERVVQLCDAMIARKQDQAEPYYKRANAFNGLGRWERALTDYDRAIDLNPAYSHAFCNRGVVLEQLHRWDEALKSYDRALALDPEDFLSHCNRGSVLRKLKRFEEALISYDQAIAIKSDYVEAYFYRGAVLHELGRFDAAIASHDKAIEFTPSGLLPYMAYSSRAYALVELKRFDQALASYGQAIALKGDYAEAHYGRGLALHQVGRLEDALASYEHAVALQDDYAEAYINRGSVLLELRRYEAAVSSFDRAIELKAMHARLFQGRGLALRQLRRLDEALTSFERAISIKSECADFHVDRANVLLEVGRYEAALASYDQAIELKSSYVEALQGRGFALLNLKRLEAAIASFDQALAVNPDQKYLFGLRRHLKMQICDWKDLETDIEKLTKGLQAGIPVSTPFPMLALIDSAPVHRLAAKLWAEEQYPQDDSLGPISMRLPASKIHIAYFSPDFRNHPVSLLTSELFEIHDRSRFHVTAIAFGPKTDDSVRTRLEHAFDGFIEVGDQSDIQVASLARSLGVDIAVDLAGFTEHGRTKVFALRAAPIQISYLGYLGTMAAPYMDYLLADAMIIPGSEQQHYMEKIIYLPSYQANDSKRRIAERTFTREELGLPREGFVFACFNANYKITPATFEVWMRILGQVQGSNLFLYVGDQVAERNIHKEGERRGIDSRRIVFGEKLVFEEYLARFRAVDLFLDTLPYNAGTTASDALWAGLPVLTCMGQAFAGRVAASLLTAINLPELITSTPAQYEELAVELATNPRMMAHIRQKLAANRLAAPLFNTAQFARTLEAAYTQIYERYNAGLRPEHVNIERSGWSQ